MAEITRYGDKRSTAISYMSYIGSYARLGATERHAMLSTQVMQIHVYAATDLVHTSHLMSSATSART